MVGESDYSISCIRLNLHDAYIKYRGDKVSSWWDINLNSASNTNIVYAKAKYQKLSIIQK